jgi:hypothetical protein
VAGERPGGRERGDDSSLLYTINENTDRPSLQHDSAAEDGYQEHRILSLSSCRLMGCGGEEGGDVYVGMLCDSRGEVTLLTIDPDAIARTRLNSNSADGDGDGDGDGENDIDIDEALESRERNSLVEGLKLKQQKGVVKDDKTPNRALTIDVFQASEYPILSSAIVMCSFVEEKKERGEGGGGSFHIGVFGDTMGRLCLYMLNTSSINGR